MTYSVITLVIILQFSIPRKYDTLTDVECLQLDGCPLLKRHLACLTQLSFCQPWSTDGLVSCGFTCAFVSPFIADSTPEYVIFNGGVRAWPELKKKKNYAPALHFPMHRWIQRVCTECFWPLATSSISARRLLLEEVGQKRKREFLPFCNGSRTPII